MFVSELTPFVQALAHQPVAFCGGFFSGLFRLNLAEDPVRSWLDKQGAHPVNDSNLSEPSTSATKGPQSIDIE